MCLSRPAEVVALDEAGATVRLNGQLVRVDTRAIGEVAVGDRLLVHAGLALERLEPEEADDLDALLAGWDELTSEAMASATSTLDEVKP